MTRDRTWVWKLAVAALIGLSVGALLDREFTQEIAGHGLINYSDAPLPNYAVVWDHKLTRSGMPWGHSGWQWLRKQGVKSVVTFRMKNDVDYDKFGFEHVLHLPMTSNPPTDEQAEQFLRFIQDPRNQPVHIHCAAGKDRTGIMAALLRYSIDGWSVDKALAEARLYRDGSDLSEKSIEWLKNWAAKHEPGSFRSNP